MAQSASEKGRPGRQDFDLKETLSTNKAVGLWRMLTGYRWLYLIAVVSLGLGALAGTATVYLLRYLVDDVLLKDQLAELIPWIAAGFVGLAAVQGLFTFLGGRLSAQTAEGVTLRLRNYLYDHLQRLSFTYHDNAQTGDLIQRATSDVDALRRLFAVQLVGVGRLTTLFLVNFIALLTLNVPLAFFSVIVVPLTVVLAFYFFRRLEKVYESYQVQEAKLSTRLQENLSGVRVVKAFARQEYETDQFEGESWGLFQRGQRLILMHSLFWPAGDILTGVQMLIGFYLGARLAITGEITPGAYLAFSGLLVQILWPIRHLGQLIAQMSTGFVSFERLAVIIRQDRESLDTGDYRPASGVQGHIRFEEIGFTYEHSKDAPGEESAESSNHTPVVLHDISFEVQPGQVVALLGSTGAGKSSLVNLLPRFYDYTAGRILLDGVELTAYPRSFLRRQMGIVPQEPFLFSRSIRENISYGAAGQVGEEEIVQAAKAASIHESIVSFPQGYDTLVGERGVTLSGGQKQRLTIARTLLQNPAILILDDATSSVDTQTESSIREALNRLMENRTTFIIAHRIQSVMVADLILVLDQGRIVQRGTHAELVAQPGIYRQIYELQARIEEDLQGELAAVAQPDQAPDYPAAGPFNGHGNRAKQGQLTPAD